MTNVFGRVDFGTEISEQIEDNVKNQIAKAIAKGFPPSRENALRKIVHSHAGVFKMRLINDAPAGTAPIRTRRDETRELVILPVRTYIANQTEVMDKYPKHWLILDQLSRIPRLHERWLPFQHLKVAKQT